MVLSPGPHWHAQLLSRVPVLDRKAEGVMFILFITFIMFIMFITFIMFIMLVAVSFRASTLPSQDNAQISLLPSLSALAPLQGFLQAQGTAGQETGGH